MTILRSTEDHPLINKEVNWEDMVSLVESFGIGTSDAMILNLFQYSKYSNLEKIMSTNTDLIYSIKKLLKNGNSIKAISYLQAKYKLGLKVSKDIVDKIKKCLMFNY